ncbi:sodium:proton antiporter [bacterium]|nr:sodium:proton antiporter [bacterium]
MEALAREKRMTAELPPPALIVPFVLLLGLIAMGPLFFPKVWHSFYPAISLVLGVSVAGYYLGILHDAHRVVHAMSEYVSFIALLTALFFAAGGIFIKVNAKGTAVENVIFLLIGGILANFIGTTGASMLLIHPYIRLNKGHIRPYHIVFFIFVVSNVGGCLKPIGDPPLFLGFLKGVPFFWTFHSLFFHWLVAMTLILAVFYVIDKRDEKTREWAISFPERFEILGARNFVWLAVTNVSVFLDPNLFEWVPSIDYHGSKISFLREAIMFGAAAAAYRTANREALEGNEFSFEPIREVAWLFIGIFLTMIPALQWVSHYAGLRGDILTVHAFYWGTGILSSILDNAPTYLNFLAAGLGKAGLSIESIADVRKFAAGAPMGASESTTTYLIAISVASVFFGAMSYIGNGPNFMVKSIAQHMGIHMPSFLGYVGRYSLPVLLPILTIVWAVFFLR